MRRRRVARAALAGGALVAVVVCVGVGLAARSAGLVDVLWALALEPDGAGVSDPASFERWLLARPASFGLVVGTVGQAEEIAWNADVARPLASTQKIVVLLAYALAAADGRLDPRARVRRADWEARYLPGTDADAHPRALARLGLAEGVDPTLDHLASAMIRESDNAATDLLLALIPPVDLERAQALLGDGAVEPLHPLLGDALIVAEGDPCTRTPEDREARITALVEGFVRSRAEVRLPDLRSQRARLACVAARGTPRGFARVLGRIATGEGMAPEAAATVRRHLEWPMESAAAAAAFDRFGAKNGMLPGVWTEALYVVPRSGPYAGRVRVVVWFTDGVGVGAWLALIRGTPQQAWMLDLATDPARVEVVRTALPQ